VESPEFRQLLLYCARQLSDDNIPHRTKTTKEMVRLFYELMEKWAEELQVSVLLIPCMFLTRIPEYAGSHFIYHGYLD
jgi:hypothetical protein